MRRRTFLRTSAAAAVLTAGFGPDFWRSAYAATAVRGEGPYGWLGGPDRNGIRLPAGFSSRMVARTGRQPTGSGYYWHKAPDGGGCFPASDGGWVYVSNAESGSSGGAGALRFNRDGRVVDAYPILTGTVRNCAGGVTPWGTWLSCEETDRGQVYECDPFARAGERRYYARPQMGRFAHEAAAVDPVGRCVYLTEDDREGRLYRFTPWNWHDLRWGKLEAARREGGDTGTLRWVVVAEDRPARNWDTSVFAGGEGIWHDRGWMYFTTKHDNKVWALELSSQRYEVIYAPWMVSDPILTGIDNIFVSPFSGDVFVAEDGGSMDLAILAPPTTSGAPWIAARFLTITGQSGSEITGPAMSPDGRRLYLSSQRGWDGSGVTYEISGPFRNTRSVSNSLLDPEAIIPEFPLTVMGGLGAAAVLGAAAMRRAAD